MKGMRRGVGEGMLRSVYVCGELLDGLFCRGELWYIVSNLCLRFQMRKVYRCNIHVKWPNVSSRLGLNYLFLGQRADWDVDYETSPFEIYRQRTSERRMRRSSEDHDLCPGSILSTPCPSLDSVISPSPPYNEGSSTNECDYRCCPRSMFRNPKASSFVVTKRHS